MPYYKGDGKFTLTMKSAQENHTNIQKSLETNQSQKPSFLFVQFWLARNFHEFSPIRIWNDMLRTWNEGCKLAKSQTEG